MGADPPEKGPDKPILIGSSVADRASTLNNIAIKKITRPEGQKQAVVTVYLPSLFWQEDFRQVSATVYQHVSSVANKSPIHKNALQKTKKPA
ncbi:MAG: hypothetical protein LW731_04955 [Oxalobacteraceae bacterium]|nr:hypothetical protein [Oxalobacteraceae bacterium]